MSCRDCQHASHRPSGILTSRGCLASGCWCLQTNDASGNLMAAPAHIPSVEERAEIRRRREQARA